VRLGKFAQVVNVAAVFGLMLKAVAAAFSMQPSGRICLIALDCEQPAGHSCDDPFELPEEQTARHNQLLWF
jgi:hypothetical protein